MLLLIARRGVTDLLSFMRTYTRNTGYRSIRQSFQKRVPTNKPRSHSWGEFLFFTKKKHNPPLLHPTRYNVSLRKQFVAATIARSRGYSSRQDYLNWEQILLWNFSKVFLVALALFGGVCTLRYSYTWYEVYPGNIPGQKPKSPTGITVYVKPSRCHRRRRVT